MWSGLLLALASLTAVCVLLGLGRLRFTEVCRQIELSMMTRVHTIGAMRNVAAQPARLPHRCSRRAALAVRAARGSGEAKG